MPREISKDVPYIPCRKYSVIFPTSMPIFLTFYFNEWGLQRCHVSACLFNIFSILLFGDWLSLQTSFHPHIWSLETGRADSLHGQGSPWHRAGVGVGGRPLATVAETCRAAQTPMGLNPHGWTWGGISDPHKSLLLNKSFLLSCQEVENVLCHPFSGCVMAT